MSAETYLDPAFTLSSSAFVNDDAIPEEYTVDGLGISPPLAWGFVPEGAQSFALIVYDPDAPKGDFTHWVLYDIPPETLSLPENVVSSLGVQGVNSAGESGWTPPAPPAGDPPHRYIFMVMALDKPTLNLPAGATRDQVEDAAMPHTLSVAAIRGRYAHAERMVCECVVV